ncbi:DUF2490 domain-containing protein [Flavobacterium sp. 3HN19-14]|uniref:DUF2490 domain-containing protein n=1 Tax=Flavobacterium sp. 3HN19-14 TaxID=3448133 RepID=UPI003EDF73E4
MNFRAIITSLIVLTFFSATAQDADTGMWFTYFGNQKFHKKWNFHNEVQYRNYNFVGDLEQFMVRTGIGYDITENNNNALVGYAYVHSEPYNAAGEKGNTNEHRIFEQFITKQQFGRVNILHRYRFEQRFIGDDYKMRLRYFLSVNVPLNKKVMDKHTIYASATNEIFINTKENHYDRNRVFGGLGYCFNKFVRVEAGYMRQFLPGKSRGQFQVMLFNNLPF